MISLSNSCKCPRVEKLGSAMTISLSLVNPTLFLYCTNFTNPNANDPERHKYKIVLPVCFGFSWPPFGAPPFLELLFGTTSIVGGSV